MDMVTLLNKTFFLRCKSLINDAYDVRDCIFEEACDIDSSDAEYGNSVLFWAVYDGELDVARKLCNSKEIDVNFGGFGYHTPLHAACVNGNVEMAELLLKKGAKVDAVDIDGFTPLSQALRCGSREVVSLLVRYNCDVNYAHSEYYDFTPLHITVCANMVDIIKELLAVKTIDVNCVDKRGRTPLHIAVTYGRLEAVQLLISAENVVDPNVPEHNGYTALHLAAELYNLDIFYELLVLKDIDINCRAFNADTPLHMACAAGNLEMVKGLLKKNADVNAVGEFGFLPLHLAAERGFVDIVKVLIKYKSEVSPRNERKNTPLHLAAQFGYIKTVIWLLKNGADLNAQNQDNETPLKVARTYGENNVCDLLEFKKNNLILKL